MLSTVHKNVQQLFNFSGSTGLATDMAEFGEHDGLVMLSKVQRNVQKNLISR